MKKTIYKIFCVDRDGKNSYEKVTGDIYGSFGIHKAEILEKGKIKKRYNITHIRTGMVVIKVDLKKQAVEIVKRFNQAFWPTSWDNDDIKELSKNAAKAKEIIDIVMTTSKLSKEK